MAEVVKRPLIFTNRGMAWVVISVAILWAMIQTGLGQTALFNPGGIPQLLQFFRASLQPDLTPAFLRIILRATGVTFAYAVCGTVLSLGLGFIGGVFSAEIWWQTLLPKGGSQLLWTSIRSVLAFPRAIHELIWGLFFINILGLDPLVGVVAIAIPFGAIVAKVFSEILDETDHAPLKALLHAGVSPLKAFLYGLLPQALPNLLSYSFYRFECALRASAVLGIIGAGGLGYEIFLSLQSLRYEQLWTGFYALILLNGAVDAWSGYVRKQLGLASRLDLRKPAPSAPSSKSSLLGTFDHRAGTRPCPYPPNSPNPDDGFADCETLTNCNHSDCLTHPTLANKQRPRRYLNLIQYFLISLTILLCFHSLHLDWSQLWSPKTSALLQDILSQARPGVVTFAQVSALISLSAKTVAMSILAIAISTVGGTLFSFLAARNFWQPGGLLYPDTVERHRLGWLVLFLSRLALLVSRAIPAPIWALVFLFVVFPGILPGALALAIHNFGILGRLKAEVNENLDERPVKALRTMGVSLPNVICYGVLPQNLTRFMAYSLYRWEVCLRATVIVGLVGAGGLGRLLTEQLSSFDYGGVTVTLSVFVLLTFAVDIVSAVLRRSLR